MKLRKFDFFFCGFNAKGRLEAIQETQSPLVEVLALVVRAELSETLKRREVQAVGDFINETKH